MTITPPVIVCEGLDLSFYDSIEAAEMAMEGPDVLNGIYLAFDSKGKILDLLSDGGPHDYSARVRIEEGEREAAPDELVNILSRYLNAIGVEPPEPRTLNTLLARAIRAKNKP